MDGAPVVQGGTFQRQRQPVRWARKSARRSQSVSMLTCSRRARDWSGMERPVRGVRLLCGLHGLVAEARCPPSCNLNSPRSSRNLAISVIDGTERHTFGELARRTGLASPRSASTRTVGWSNRCAPRQSAPLPAQRHPAVEHILIVQKLGSEETANIRARCPRAARRAATGGRSARRSAAGWTSGSCNCRRCATISTAASVAGA